MEYALKVLNRYGPVVNGPPGGSASWMKCPALIAAAGGADPKYSSASGCPVCRGAGAVRVTPPVVTCRQCAGSGRVGGDLICLTCRGVGVVSVPFEADTCPGAAARRKQGFFIVTPVKGKGSSDLDRRRKGELT